MALLARLRSRIPKLRSEAQAREVFLFLWKQTARAGKTRHPFHREVLNDLDVLLGMVEAAPGDTNVEIDGTCMLWGDVQRERRTVARRITRAWMYRRVLEEVARAVAVADSTEYLTERSQTVISGRTNHQLTVQHRLSGLRACFYWCDGIRVGRVTAKSYSFLSIDPDAISRQDGLQALENWEGLGITSGLYQHAATLLPDMRWAVGSLTEQSARLRRNLHCIDPWRFAAAADPQQFPDDACRWCIRHDWALLDHAGFASHPAGAQGGHT
jgi:hypothetical protein